MKTKQTTGDGDWLGEIAELGLAQISKDREFAIIWMDGKGRIWPHDKTYTDHRIAAGQATRISNASAGDGFLRGYIVAKYAKKAFVFAGTDTILWRGEIS